MGELGEIGCFSTLTLPGGVHSLSKAPWVDRLFAALLNDWGRIRDTFPWLYPYCMTQNTCATFTQRPPQPYCVACR
jgi:hypothetical protein